MLKFEKMIRQWLLELLPISLHKYFNAVKSYLHQEFRFECIKELSYTLWSQQLDIHYSHTVLLFQAEESA